MPCVWGWFSDLYAFREFVEAHRSTAKISVWVRPPGKRFNEVVVVGPQSRDVAPYPFLDACHHLRRLGLDIAHARRYAQKLLEGAQLLCLEAEPGAFDHIRDGFPGYDAQLLD